LLSLLHWHFHIVAVASSPTLLRWRCCGCFDGAVTIVQVYFAVVALVLFPLLRWHCFNCCAGITALNALVLLSLLCWCCLFFLHWHLCHCYTGVVAIVAMAPLPLLRWLLSLKGVLD
jgi:hypothetical protein